jgi:enoyl-[acyl-carrier protein] reductase I
MDGELSGKVGIVLGIANRHSIAWAVAQAWAHAGASLVLSCQSERVRPKVEELARGLGTDTLVATCDVASDANIQEFFELVRKHTDHVDFLMHSIAFAPKESLEGPFYDTTREAFRATHEISVYSFVSVVRHALPCLADGASVMTLSFHGARKVVPHYNVMGVAKAALEASVRYLAHDLGPQGVRVNAISAGPLNTVAARGIRDFPEILKKYAILAPLGRSCTAHEVGNAAMFLAGPRSSGITGQILYVDGGYEIMGVG